MTPWMRGTVAVDSGPPWAQGDSAHGVQLEQAPSWVGHCQAPGEPSGPTAAR
jgi:hypothetical protein